jgi:hypothetical protein
MHTGICIHKRTNTNTHAHMRSWWEDRPSQALPMIVSILYCVCVCLSVCLCLCLYVCVY